MSCTCVWYCMFTPSGKFFVFIFIASNFKFLPVVPAVFPSWTSDCQPIFSTCVEYMICGVVLSIFIVFSIFPISTVLSLFVNSNFNVCLPFSISFKSFKFTLKLYYFSPFPIFICSSVFVISLTVKFFV